MSDLIRVDEAAKRLGVSRTVIYRLMADGVLPKLKMLGVLVINPDDLKRSEVANRKSGRPSKK